MANIKFFLLIVFFGFSCMDKNLHPEITGIKEISEIHSASGIEIFNQQIFIIGDNSPWLFRLDSKFNITGKFPLHQSFAEKYDIIPKSIKPDYEALTGFTQSKRKKLMVFGSGSLPKTRDQLLIVDPDKSELKVYSLTALYQSLVYLANIKPEDLNIEAAACSDEHLYLLNRGKNILFKCSLADFLLYIERGQEIPVFHFTRFKLPEIGGVEAGFSGACINRDQTKILFTASVENTKNWVADGEVTGSFIGFINLKNTEIKTAQLKIKDNDFLSKVESIAIQKEFKDSYELLLVTDNDGKASQIITAKLRF